MPEPKIAVTLSGGGYRASLFGLGVLLYLVDARKNLDVTSISSVSGGSFTNGFVAQAGDYSKAERDGFRRTVQPFVWTVAHQTAWSTPLVWLYLVALIASLAAIIWVSFWLVTIEQSPFKVPRYFAKHGTPDEVERANAVMSELGDEDAWDRIAEEDANVATTLSKLGTEVSARLLRHGYATAMANLHVILNYPLIDLPDVEAFESLAGGP